MLSDLAYRARALLGRGRMESELDEELRYHFDRQVDEFLSQGLPPQEARRRARLLFGGLDQVKEECRDARGVSLLEAAMEDLRYACRLLARSPGFAALSVLSLAAGVAAAALSGSLFSQAVLTPLPVSAPEQLVALESPGPWLGFTINRGGPDAAYFSYPMYLDLRDHNTVFRGVAARSNTYVGLAGGGSAPAAAELVTSNYFEVLGVQPAAGRLFTRADDSVIPPYPIVLSHEFWRRRFASDPSVIGRTFPLNGIPVTVAGVSAAGWRGVVRGRSPDVYIPISARQKIQGGGSRWSLRRTNWLTIVARLKPGVSLESARVALQPVYHKLLEAEPGPRPGDAQFLSRPLHLVPAARGIALGSELGRMTGGLCGMAAYLLLTACANVAGLCLARSAARRKEIAIRAALGASRVRVAGQLLAEFLLPAAAGGALGLLGALLAGGAVPGLLFSEEAARSFATTFSPGALALSLAASGVIAALCGAAPALLPVLRRPQSALNGPPAVSLRAGRPRLRKALVFAQVALSTGLVFGALSLHRDFVQEREDRLGARRENRIGFTLHAPGGAPQYQALAASLARLPHVQAAGFWTGSYWRFVLDRPPLADPALRCCQWLLVSPGYFDAAGYSIRNGNGKAWTPRTLLVNEAFERRVLGGRSALGALLRPVGGQGQRFEVVGVVRDGASAYLYSDQPTVLSPYAGASPVGFWVSAKTGPAADLLAGVRRRIAAEAPGATLRDAGTLDRRFAESHRGELVLNGALGAFALLSIILAAVGVYGLISYVVFMRTRELGVRMALGATPAAVIALVMKETAQMTLAGVAVGLSLALLLSRWIVGDGVGLLAVKEWPAAAAAALLVAAAGALAALAPALRATRIDRAAALHED